MSQNPGFGSSPPRLFSLGELRDGTKRDKIHHLGILNIPKAFPGTKKMTFWLGVNFSPRSWNLFGIWAGFGVENTKMVQLFLGWVLSDLIQNIPNLSLLVPGGVGALEIWE